MGEPFIVQVPNRPGEFGHLARALGMRGINITNFSGSGAGDVACALLTTDDDEATREVLRSMGLAFVAGSTIMIEIEDKPGALADITERLGRAKILIKGICMIGCREGHREFAISVEDEDAARAALGLPPIAHLAAVR